MTDNIAAVDFPSVDIGRSKIVPLFLVFYGLRACFLVATKEKLSPYLLVLGIGTSSRWPGFYHFFESEFVVSIIIFRHHHFVKIRRHFGVRVLSRLIGFHFVSCLPFFSLFLAWNRWPMPCTAGVTWILSPVFCRTDFILFSDKKIAVSESTATVNGLARDTDKVWARPLPPPRLPPNSMH